MGDMLLGGKSNMKIVVDDKVIDDVDLVIKDNTAIYKDDNEIQGGNSNMKIVLDGKIVENVYLVIKDNIVIFKEDNEIQVVNLQ